MLKIDIDDVHPRPRLALQMLLYTMPRPFFSRISSSGEGLHIACPQCKEWDFRRIAYDDQMRVDLDQHRIKIGIPVHNLLWDIKNGMAAGTWQVIRTERDIEDYLDVIKAI